MIVAVQLPEYDGGKSISTLLITPPSRSPRGSRGRRGRVDHEHHPLAALLQQQREDRIVEAEIERRRVGRGQLGVSAFPQSHHSRGAEVQQRPRVVEDAEVRTDGVPAPGRLVEGPHLAEIQRRGTQRERVRREELVPYARNVETGKPMKSWR